MQHKLEINAYGDIDFTNQPNMTNNNASKNSFYNSKLPKNQQDSKLFSNTNANNSNLEARASTSNEANNMPPSQYSKSTSKSAHKSSKNIFRKQSNTSSLKNDEDQDKQQLIMDTSFESTNTTSIAKNNKKSEN